MRTDTKWTTHDDARVRAYTAGYVAGRAAGRAEALEEWIGGPARGGHVGRVVYDRDGLEIALDFVAGVLEHWHAWRARRSRR